MIFDYLKTGFQVIVGLVDNNILTIAALAALGLMVLWIICALLTSYQFRFSMRARKLNKYVLANGIEGESKMHLRYLLSKMPTEFYRGYTAFERDTSKLPSHYIKRFESLEMEISGGVFNQNKSILKTYTNFIFISLLVLCFGRLSNAPLTGALIAEAVILPLAFLLLSRIIYYVYTAIRQHQYNVAVEDFNEVVDCLDKIAMQTYGLNVAERTVRRTENVNPTTQEGGEKEQVASSYEEEKQENMQEVPETHENDKVQKIDLSELRNAQEEIRAEQGFAPIEADNFVVEEPERVEEVESEKEEVQENVQKIDLTELRSVQEEIRAEQEIVEEPQYQEDVATEEFETAEAVEESIVEDESKVEEEQEVEVVEEKTAPVAYQIKENVQEVEEVLPVEDQQIEEKPKIILDDSLENVIFKFNFLKEENEREKVKAKEEKEPKNIKEGRTRMVGVTDNFKPDFETLFDEEEMVAAPKRGRGRPKKVVQENGEFVIHNDKEFEDALVRAEKLMRKNEEPLSASQTKRIEKQLKELIDAMTKYKEGK